MTWFTANVTLTNTSQVVVWNSGDPLSKLNAGDGLIVNGDTPLEILSVGSSDFLLKTPWASSTVTVSVTAQPIPGDFASATQNLREVSIFANSLYSQLTDWAAATTTSVTITDAAGVSTSVPTPKVITDAIAGLGTSSALDATTSTTDTTAGRVLKVGDFGLGDKSLGTAASTVAHMPYTGFARVAAGDATGTPDDTKTWNMVGCEVGGGAGQGAAIALEEVSANPRVFIYGASSGVYSPWAEMYHAGNNGGIIYGSNANGDYVKFPDGTLICNVVTAAASAPNTVNGNVFSSSSKLWTYPSAFITNPPNIMRDGMSGSVGMWVGLGDASTTITNTSFKVYRATTDSAIPTVSLVAIGRWK